MQKCRPSTRRMRTNDDLNERPIGSSDYKTTTVIPTEHLFEGVRIDLTPITCETARREERQLGRRYRSGGTNKVRNVSIEYLSFDITDTEEGMYT